MAKPTPWYKYPYANDYAAGQDPFGNFPKPDLNIQCPDGTPITNLLAGTVSGLNSADGSVPAWGACVTLRLDKPINEVATHIAYLHLEPLPSFLTIGLHVPAGEVIGYSGGASAQGLEKVPVGVALYNGNLYGYGPTWNLYVGSSWLDPTPVLAKVGNKGTGKKTAGETITSIAEHIRPDESVAQLLAGMDVALVIENPFSRDAAVSGIVPLNPDGSCPVGYHRVTAPSGKALCYIDTAPTNSPTGLSLFGLVGSIKDPYTYLGDVAEGLIQNFVAVFIRTLFIVFGVIVLVVILQATFTTAVNKALEPVGGISGAIKTASSLA